MPSSIEYFKPKPIGAKHLIRHVRYFESQIDILTKDMSEEDYIKLIGQLGIRLLLKRQYLTKIQNEQ